MLKNLVILVFISVFIASCGRYSRVLNKGTIEQQYKLATELYENEKYEKAIKLFEKTTKGYEGKPQMERIQYMISDSYYKTRQYTLSSYYFKRFCENYPNSSKVEEANYLSANSYYMLSPVYSLDQTETYEALSEVQAFIDKYPDSEYLPQANEQIKELRYKLEKKAFETAKQYYRIGDYTASITSFDNLLSDYLGTTFKEEALYYKFKASYELAVKSVFSKKEARLKSAVKAYDKLKRNFPESKHLKESDKLLEDLNKKLSDFILT